MNYFKSFLKLSLLLLILLACVGSIHAVDDSQIDLDSSCDDGDCLEMDDDLDEIDSDEIDDDLYDSNEDIEDDVILSDDDDDEEDGDDLDDDYDPGYEFSDYDYLKLKITYYLDRYGNYSGHNWTESEEFKAEYKIYLSNPSNYTLNESSEGYNTYLKIYDSITSTFNDYNLTENETSYLKFMVIFYLNHYGNVSANYTWNESESFSNFTFPFYYLDSAISIAKGISSGHHGFNWYSDSYNPAYNLFFNPLSNSTDVNATSNNNQTSVEASDSWLWNIAVLIFLIIMVILIL